MYMHVVSVIGPDYITFTPVPSPLSPSSVPVGWSQLIFLAQSIVCRLVFFVDKKGKFIALTNT